MISFFNVKKMKTQKKLLLSYLFLVLLPIIIISVLVIYSTVVTSIDYTDQMNRSNFNQMNTNIYNTFDSYVNYVNNISLEYPLIEYLTTEHSDSSIKRYIAYNEIFQNYSIKFPITTGNLRRLFIYTSNESVIANSAFIVPLDPVTKKEKWYQKTTTAQGRCVFLEPFYHQSLAYISIGKDLQPFSRSEYKNLLLLRIPESEIYKLIQNEDGAKEIYILNEDNIILSSSRRDLIGVDADDRPYLHEILLIAGQNKKEMFRLNTDSIFYHENENVDHLNGFKTISIISQSVIMSKIANLITVGIFFSVLCIITTVLFIMFLSNTITKKLKLLVDNISDINGNHFNLSVHFEDEDEISELYGSLKDMMLRIDTLIKEVYMLEIEKKDAEIKALQSQINPHFIFNTMETVRMNLRKNNDFKNAEIIRKFATLLRKTMDWSSDMITLYRETELIETYLQISQYRYENKFAFSIDIDEDLYSYQIPKFMLQPLVENAIYHGIEMKKGYARLHITGKAEDDVIKLIVEDDGVGISEDEVNNIKEGIISTHVNTDKSSIGMRNVHRRIMLYYGEPYGLHISSIKGEGTRIEIHLPNNMHIDKGC